MVLWQHAQVKTLKEMAVHPVATITLPDTQPIDILCLLCYIYINY